MPPDQGRNPEMDNNGEYKQRVQEMLGSVMDAVGEEDYEFAENL